MEKAFQLGASDDEIVAALQESQPILRERAIALAARHLAPETLGRMTSFVRGPSGSGSTPFAFSCSTDLKRITPFAELTFSTRRTEMCVAWLHRFPNVGGRMLM